jgi:O-antigen/teichoic acid export membrane protein
MHYFGGVWAQLSESKNLSSALGSSYGLMILTMVIQFALVPFYLHHLGKEMFGVLMMILAAISYGAIGITWLSGGMARILGERGAIHDAKGFADAYAVSKLVYVGYAIIAIALFWLVAPFIMPNALEKTEVHQALILISIYFLLMYEYNTDRLAFNALCRQTTGNVIEAAGQVVFAGSVGVGLYLGGGMVSVVVALIAGVLTARSLALMYWYRQKMGLGWRWPHLLDAAPMWQRVSGKMGRHYVVYGILLLTLQADVLIVGWLAGQEIAAAYYLLWRIPEVCILLLGRIPGVFAPHLIQMDARGDTDKIHLAYRKGLRIVFGLSALAGVAYGLLGNWFVHLWVGNNAPDGLLPYVLAGMALFFVAAIQWPANTAYALVNTGPLVKVTALYLVVKLGMFVLLFGQLDYLAPLVAIIASHVLGVFFLYMKVGKDACRVNINLAEQN